MSQSFTFTSVPHPGGSVPQLTIQMNVALARDANGNVKYQGGKPMIEFGAADAESARRLCLLATDAYSFVKFDNESALGQLLGEAYATEAALVGYTATANEKFFYGRGFAAEAINQCSRIISDEVSDNQDGYGSLQFVGWPDPDGPKVDFVYTSDDDSYVLVGDSARDTIVSTVFPSEGHAYSETFQILPDGSVRLVDRSTPFGTVFGSANGGEASTSDAQTAANAILALLRSSPTTQQDWSAILASEWAAVINAYIDTFDFRLDTTQFAALTNGQAATVSSPIGTLTLQIATPEVTNGVVTGTLTVRNSDGKVLRQYTDAYFASGGGVPSGQSAAVPVNPFDPAFLDPQYGAPTGTPSTPVDNSILNITYVPPGTTIDSTSWNSGSQWVNGIHTDQYTHQIGIAPGVLNDPSNLFYNWVPSAIAGDFYSPGREIVSPSQLFFSSAAYDFNQSLSFDNPFELPLTFFGSFNQQFLNIDPLVIDLNGDGAKIIDFDTRAVFFDIDADGYLEQTSWLAPEDGLLVKDLNSDGVISDITEIVSDRFNGRTADGTAAIVVLSAFDTNNDGLFSALDTDFSSFRIWKDANGNGITDTGELQTLVEAGVVSFNLAHSPQHGLVENGANILATSTATLSDNSEAQVLSVEFIADPLGSIIEAIGSDYKSIIQSRDGGPDFSALIAGGALNVDLSVSNTEEYVHIFGSDDDDTITGDAGDNWIVGGKGSDTLDGGAGNDFLVIDADDDLDALDGGTGFDVVQAVGSRGIALNLTEANVEAAIGTSSSDILVGGGYSNVFILGGAGSDLIYGGAADDALSGEDGDDLLEGMAGDDILRGHRGSDLLRGGAGDDMLYGGDDQDVLLGAAGNDFLDGGKGDDALDGGDGIDTANFTGKFSDYTFEKAGNEWIVRDKRAGGDGVDRLINIEKVSFSNMKDGELSMESPLIVNDLVEGNGSAPVVIAKSELLGNDLDFQGDALTITSVTNAIGGTVALNGQGNVVFTPDANYFGVRSFQYTVQDSHGHTGAELTYTTTGEQAEMKGVVRLTEPDHPIDPLFYDQWYVSDANILPVWGDYTGKGIEIAIFEPGVMDFHHSDLVTNVSSDFLENYPTPDSLIARHATLVAGVIAGGRNDQGTVGVAYDAKLSSFALDGPYPDAAYRNYDVVNNSWGYDEHFVSDFVAYPTTRPLFEEAAAYGRGGLGTSIVFSA